MPNSLAAMQQQNLAGGLDVLRTKFAVLKAATNYNFDPVPGDRKSSVEIYLTQRGSATSVIPGNVPPAAGDALTEAKLIPCDQWDEATFTLTDNEVASISEAKMRLLIQQKASDLADAVSQKVMIAAKNGFGLYTGTPGTAPFASTVQPAVTAGRLLNDNRVPSERRALILSTSSYADAVMLPALQQWQNSADPGVITEAQLGRKFGIDWYWDNGMPTHTAGTAASFVVAATAVGQNTTTISGGTGTFNVGDLFTVAGATGKTYVVLAGTTSTVLNYGPRNDVAWTASSAITRIASHNNDLLIQPDGLAFVTRSEVDMSAMSGKVGAYDMTLTDPVSGLSLRSKITQEHYQWRFALSILHGEQVIRPEFGVRIIS
jgi:hypothetical protein